MLYGLFAAAARARDLLAMMRWLRRSFAGAFAALGPRLAFMER